VSWVALTTVVVSLFPFHATDAPDAKLLPLTVSVKAEPPALTEVGEIEEITPVALGFAIVHVATFDVPPPGAGFITETLLVEGNAAN
jgi:hypothetical protein